MSQKTLNLCLERYNFVKFGETAKSSHTVLCTNNAYSVNSDNYRLTPTAIASKHGEGYVFTLNYDFDRPLFTIVQKSYTLDGTSGNIVFEGIDPISKGGSKYLRKVTVSPVKLSDGSYLLEVTNDEYLRIGTTGAALGDEDLESLNEKIVATGGIEKSVETVGGKQVLKLDASGSTGAKEIVYFDVDPSDPPSGIYEAIGEALSNNKEPVIKNEGTVYFYSSTSSDKYVFVGGYNTEVVNYTTVTVSYDDSVVMETVDTIEGMVFPLYYHSTGEGFTVADKTGHALTKTKIADAYRAGQIFMFSSYPASNTQAHWGYCCDIDIDSDNTGYAEFFILAAFGGDSYEWEKYRINLSSGTEFVTLWGPNTSYSTGYSGYYADGATTVSVSTTQNFNSTQKAKGRDNIGAASASDVTALQSQVSSLSDVSAYSVKGEATVAQLNAGPSGIQAGWAYQLTDSGTLTDGSLAVVAGDTVAWDGTKWFPLVKSDYYATKTYAQNVAHSIAPEFVPNETNAVAGKLYMYGGKLYIAKVNYTGAWDSSKFKQSPVSDLIERIQENNIIDLFADYPYTVNRETSGITFVGDAATKTINVSGTATALAIENLINSSESLPMGWKAGYTISFEVSGFSASGVVLRLFYYPNTLPDRNIEITSNTHVKLPDACTGILLRLEVANGVALPVGGVDVKIKILNKLSFSELENEFDKIELAALSTKVKIDELGIEQYNDGSAHELGELKENNLKLYKVYNSQASQGANGTLSKTTFSSEDLLNKNSILSSSDVNILPILSHREGSTNSGITFAWKNSKTIHLSGTASGLAVYNLIVSRTKLIAGVKAGDDVLVKLDNFPSGVTLDIFVYTNNSTSSSYSVNLSRTQFVRVPSDCTGLMIRIGVQNGTNLSSGIDLGLEIIANSTIKHLKLLCIGNSYTNDCTAYTPLVMENICKDVAITMGTSYYSGASIDQYVSFFDNDTASLIYYKYNGLSGRWDSGLSSKTIKQIVADEDWDIILFQQASMSQGDWSTFSNLNTLIDKILGYNATLHSKSVKVGWLMPQLRLSASEVTYEDVVSCVEKVLETTPIDFFIPCGTAVQTARGTSLNSIGNSGGLTADANGHLQAGLPSLLASYVTALKLFELFGKNCIGILQEKTRPTSDWISAHHTPGENGSSTGVTDANCYLAQKCAVAAIKTPMEIASIAE